MIVNSNSLLISAPIECMLSKKVYDYGVSNGMSEAGYDIRIKQGIHFNKGWFGKRTIVRENWADQNAEWCDDEDTFKGRFCIASSVERFKMPRQMVGVVHDKSTWARRGLSVFNTVIEPGWSGFLTLELVYHGDGELTIPPGSGIAQVVFHTSSDASQYKGRYQNQEDRPVSAMASQA